MPESPSPHTTIHSSAPIRICDNGGWTDTWFAGHGCVLSLAVTPTIEVSLSEYEAGLLPAPVMINARNYGDRYAYRPGEDAFDRHPLLEAAITRFGVPDSVCCEVDVFSHVPPGASTGTSAAVTVALLAALADLNERLLSPHELAGEAHAVETEMLGLQSGIQDQLAAAYGGANWIEMDAFPQAQVTRLPLSDNFARQLDAHLLLVYLGQAHASSSVHEQVIRELEGEGPDAPRLERLRETARLAYEAVTREDLHAFGAALRENTAAQAALHPELVGERARQVIEIADALGSLGWKVNGAGGAGGSVAVVLPPGARSAFIKALEMANDEFEFIPVSFTTQGARSWRETSA